MKQKNVKSWVEWFFKDKEGHWSIIQFPNILLSAWIVLLIVNLFIDVRGLKLLQSAALFAWSYGELTRGSSYFRKAFGGVILLVVVIGFFM